MRGEHRQVLNILYCHPVPRAQVYSQLEGDRSHAVNTAWALLALLAGGYHEVDAAPLHAAARCLLALQERSGDWPQQHISGVFNRNCMITYANYRRGSLPAALRCAVLCCAVLCCAVLCCAV